MELDGSTVETGVKSLISLRGYAPYRFGGKWFIAEIAGTVFAFRTQQPLKTRAIKAGMKTLNIHTIGGKK